MIRKVNGRNVRISRVRVGMAEQSSECLDCTWATPAKLDGRVFGDATLHGLSVSHDAPSLVDELGGEGCPSFQKGMQRRPEALKQISFRGHTARAKYLYL